jgi:hypothetical protein
VYFMIRNRRIYFKGGRMLAEEHLPLFERYDSIFYPYGCGPLVSLPAPAPSPKIRSTDFLDALMGKDARDIFLQSRWVSLLGHRAYVHTLCAEPLLRIDEELRELSRESPEVAHYIDTIKVVFSMDRREVEGTENPSYHGYGLAIDIVPEDYEGKQVYWRWSAAWYGNWPSIPLSGRWKPPDLVIEIFEKNGFVWGGKWYHFDTIHFEYRPEIIELSCQSPGGGTARE